MTASFRAGLYLGLEDDLTGPLSAVNRRLTGFERRALSVADTLTTTGRRFRDTGVQVTAAGVAVGAALYQGVRAASRFEDALADVRKAADLDPTQARALGRELRTAATQSRLTREELAGIAAAGAQRGVTVPDLLPYTRMVEQAAVAFEVPAQRAGDAVGVLRNAFQLTVAEVEGPLNAINKLGDTTGANSAGLLDFTERAGGVARALSILPAQAAAFGSAIIEFGGRPPEIAARAFSTLAGRLADAENLPKRAQEAFEGLGLSAQTLGELTRKDGTEGVLTFLRAVQASENPLGALSRPLGRTLRMTWCPSSTTWTWRRPASAPTETRLPTPAPWRMSTALSSPCSPPPRSAQRTP